MNIAPFKAAALLIAIVALGTTGSGESSPPQDRQAGAQPGAPPQGTPATIPAAVVSAAEKISNDPQIAALLKEQSTDAAAKARWNQFLELVRIPSPPRRRSPTIRKSWH